VKISLGPNADCLMWTCARLSPRLHVTPTPPSCIARTP